MLEVIGPDDREETRFAHKLARQFIELWPDVEHSDEEWVTIVACAKVFGGKVQDIDILLLASLRGRRFRPRRIVRVAAAQGESEHFGDVFVRNLALTIEVKGHDPGGIRFDGLNVSVRYSSGEWKSATEQAVEQMHAFKRYCRRLGAPDPYVVNLVALQNIDERELPRRPHNIIAGDQSLASILTVVAEMKPPWQGGGGPTLSCYSDDVATGLSRLPLLRKLAPTRLDRRRMERLVARSPIVEELKPALGNTQVILRGHGGTGKTSLLLQIARSQFDDSASRSILLTYNQALAADIRRLMALTATPSAGEGGGIFVETVMTFNGRILERLGLLQEDEDFLDGYDENIATLASLLESSAPEQLIDLVDSDPQAFRFDHVLIDEGQDWPEAEISILRKIYGAGRLVIADGIDQLVRGAAADWRAGVGTTPVKVQPLTNSLRMKANLATFVNFMARELGVPGWRVEANEAAPGGRVLIVYGNYLQDMSMHAMLVDDLRATGNAPIDLLYCVPPSMVHDVGSDRRSDLAALLVQQGSTCWDGASYDIRRDIPRDVEACRIVQYHSCRGLEGWTVVALGFDEFWDARLAEARRQPQPSLSDQDAAAQLQAARWALIPLSRAMDTLVINIVDEQSTVGRALQKGVRELGDFVQVVA